MTENQGFSWHVEGNTLYISTKDRELGALYRSISNHDEWEAQLDIDTDLCATDVPLIIGSMTEAEAMEAVEDIARIELEKEVNE